MSEFSLSTLAARKLATTAKTEPQMSGITSRWLLRMLPWVQVSGGTYRINRRRKAGKADESDKYGQTPIRLVAGHEGEKSIPNTFVDYELEPLEIELSVAQTVLKVQSRVADLYNDPMNQIEEQLKLVIEQLREQQEHEMVTNPDIGLLNVCEEDHRIRKPQPGPPTPNDIDDLLARRRGTKLLLAHPRTIAAFGWECTKLGVYPQGVEVLDTQVIGWRGVPLLPCNKIPIGDDKTSSIIALRTGEKNQGVVGLHQTGIPDEYEPSLNVRFMGIDDRALISYLVSVYYSLAVLVPDALGILDNVSVPDREPGKVSEYSPSKPA